MSPDDEAEMAGAIVAAIVLGSLAVVFIIAAAIYFTCFNKHEEAYRPNERGNYFKAIKNLFLHFRL